MTEWWQDLDTKIKDVIVHQDSGITSLHVKNIDGVFHNALVWWHYGTPQLHFLFADGVILFDYNP